jgi:PPOX class probable F420-dependent enzyme
MSVAERLGRFSNKVYDRMRSKAASTISADTAVERDFEPLRGHKYATLVTFRKSGEAMPSPVWFGLDDAGRAYLHTMHDTGKVKRIRNNGRALIVASTTRGKPIGPVLAGTARVVPEDEWPHAEAALAAAYGTGRKIYQRVLGDAEGIGTYIEVSPVSPAVR